MVKLLFETLLTGLSLWESKESRKYIDRLIKLKGDWYEEYNKEIPDDNVLDLIDSELRIVGEAFINQAGAANSKDK